MISAVSIPVLALEIPEQISQRGVRVGDLTVVQTVFVNLRERGRRLVWVMRIVEVNPDKAWLLGMSVHPCFSPMDYIFAAALHASPMLAFTGV